MPPNRHPLLRNSGRLLRPVSEGCCRVHNADIQFIPIRLLNPATLTPSRICGGRLSGSCRTRTQAQTAEHRTCVIHVPPAPQRHRLICTVPIRCSAIVPSIVLTQYNFLLVISRFHSTYPLDATNGLFRTTGCVRCSGIARSSHAVCPLE